MFEDNYDQWKSSFDKLEKSEQEKHLSDFKEISNELADAFTDLEKLKKVKIDLKDD